MHQIDEKVFPGSTFLFKIIKGYSNTKLMRILFIHYLCLKKMVSLFFQLIFLARTVMIATEEMHRSLK